MKLTIVLYAVRGQEPTKADAQRNIDAVLRASVGKPNPEDAQLLRDTAHILKTIQGQLP